MKTYRKLYKISSVASDIGFNVIHSLLHPGLTIANKVGQTVGLVQDNNIDDVKQINKGKWWSTVPGLAGYRLGVRRKALSNKFGGHRNKLFSQKFGFLTSTSLLALIGARLANKAAADNNAQDIHQRTAQGALVGAALGGAAHIGGTLVGLLRSPRTDEQQQTYQESAPSTIFQYVIPGAAGYARGRNYRKLHQIDKELKKEQIQ